MQADGGLWYRRKERTKRKTGPGRGVHVGGCMHEGTERGFYVDMRGPHSEGAIYATSIGQVRRKQRSSGACWQGVVLVRQPQMPSARPPRGCAGTQTRLPPQRQQPGRGGSRVPQRARPTTWGCPLAWHARRLAWQCHWR